MIELKNVSKTYKSKKSTNTAALKDISIKFPEKGLVFILGKSGSGKSTLLNIIGGLDKYDSGEVIINGKSTKEFKEKDFDAFRNTYMGFIFQEYNLLENYSIEENIKLPLELQNIKSTDEEVKNALKQVELGDISKRKTNELSGGQKQRVAIARALIKNPEIILADEPTGNLDSTTGEQIWNILKNLSKDKLVIVVSHDNESAQKYADRIISIQDGIIISDNGEQEAVNTQEFKLLNAKLPFFYSFKMGVGSLGHKKVKLVITSVLIIFSLICFGIMLSAYVADVNSKTIELFSENGETNVFLTRFKQKISYAEKLKDESSLQYNEELEEKYSPIDIDEDFENEVKEKTGTTWSRIYDIDSSSGSTKMIYSDTTQNTDNMPMYYYIGNRFSSNFLFVETDNLNLERNIIGKMPEKDDEIMISSFVADNIIYSGCYSKDSNDEQAEVKKFKPQNYNELVNSGKYINISDMAYMKIVGIVDFSDVLSQYASMKTTKVSELSSNGDIASVLSKFSSEVYNSQYYFYVNSSFINKIKKEENTASSVKTKIKYNDKDYTSQIVAYINKEITVCDDNQIKNITEIKADEIVIDEGTLNLITDNDYANSYENEKNKYDSKEKFLVKYLKDNSIIGKTLKTSVNQGKNVDNEQDYVEYKIIGVYYEPVIDSLNSTIYYSKDVVKPLIGEKVHCEHLMKRVKTVDEMKKIVSLYPVDNSDVMSSCQYSDNAMDAISISYMLTFVSKKGVIFFLIFAALILMNFINSSIQFRKKEIGTLRAIGCRSIDIIKMFLYESLILMLITLAISFAIIPKLISAVNNFVANNLFVNMEVLKFGATQIIQITTIMLVIVILANVIPVKKITKMKPIDAILNK